MFGVSPTSGAIFRMEPSDARSEPYDLEAREVAWRVERLGVTTVRMLDAAPHKQAEVDTRRAGSPPGPSCAAMTRDALIHHMKIFRRTAGCTSEADGASAGSRLDAYDASAGSRSNAYDK